MMTWIWIGHPNVILVEFTASETNCQAWKRSRPLYPKKRGRKSRTLPHNHNNEALSERKKKRLKERFSPHHRRSKLPIFRWMNLLASCTTSRVKVASKMTETFFPILKCHRPLLSKHFLLFSTFFAHIHLVYLSCQKNLRDYETAFRLSSAVAKSQVHKLKVALCFGVVSNNWEVAWEEQSKQF